MKRFGQIVLIVAFLIVVFSACKKDDRIPYVPVNFQLSLNQPAYQELKTPGNSVSITGGVRGIIVYCNYADDYVALERNCPYQPFNDSARIYIDSTGLFAVCKHCNSKFFLMDGSIVEGVAGQNLLQYNTYLENNILYITNQY
jgi:nitrite reductase/ring-hydroxylating ferredoxin subunit